MYSNQTRAQLRCTVMYSLATLALNTGCRDHHQPDTASLADEPPPASPPSTPQQQEPDTASQTNVATRSLDLSTEAEEARNQMEQAQALKATLDRINDIKAKSASARLEAETAVSNSDANAPAMIANAKKIIGDAYKEAKTIAEKEIGIAVPLEEVVNGATHPPTQSQGEDSDATAAAQLYLAQIQADQEAVACLISPSDPPQQEPDTALPTHVAPRAFELSMRGETPTHAATAAEEARSQTETAVHNSDANGASTPASLPSDPQQWQPAPHPLDNSHNAYETAPGASTPARPTSDLQQQPDTPPLGNSHNACDTDTGASISASLPSDPQQQPDTALPTHVAPRSLELPMRRDTPTHAATAAEEACNQIREVLNAIESNYAAMTNRTLAWEEALQRAGKEIEKIETCLEQADEAPTKAAKKYLARIHPRWALAQVVKLATFSASARLAAQDAVAKSKPEAAKIIANKKTIITELYTLAQTTVAKIESALPLKGVVNGAMHTLTQSQKEDIATMESAQDYLKKIQADQKAVEALLIRPSTPPQQERAIHPQRGSNNACDTDTGASTSASPPSTPQQQETDTSRLRELHGFSGSPDLSTEVEEVRNQIREVLNAIESNYAAMTNRTLAWEEALQRAGKEIEKIETCLEQADEAPTKAAKKYLARIHPRWALAQVVKLATFSASARLAAQDAVAKSKPEAAKIIANKKTIITELYTLAQTTVAKIESALPLKGVVNGAMHTLTQSQKEDIATMESAQDYLKKIQADQKTVEAILIINHITSKYAAIHDAMRLPTDEDLSQVSTYIRQIETIEGRLTKERMCVLTIQTYLAFAQVVQLAMFSTSARLKAECAVDDSDANATTIIARSQKLIDDWYTLAQTIVAAIESALPLKGAVNGIAIENRDIIAAVQPYLAQIQADQKAVKARLSKRKRPSRLVMLPACFRGGSRQQAASLPKLIVQSPQQAASSQEPAGQSQLDHEAGAAVQESNTQ